MESCNLCTASDPNACNGDCQWKTQKKVCAPRPAENVCEDAKFRTHEVFGLLNLCGECGDYENLKACSTSGLGLKGIAECQKECFGIPAQVKLSPPKEKSKSEATIKLLVEVPFNQVRITFLDSTDGQSKWGSIQGATAQLGFRLLNAETWGANNENGISKVNGDVLTLDMAKDIQQGKIKLVLKGVQNPAERDTYVLKLEFLNRNKEVVGVSYNDVDIGSKASIIDKLTDKINNRTTTTTTRVPTFYESVSQRGSELVEHAQNLLPLFWFLAKNVPILVPSIAGQALDYYKAGTPKPILDIVRENKYLLCRLQKRYSENLGHMTTVYLTKYAGLDLDGMKKYAVEAFLSTVRGTCSGVRGLEWVRGKLLKKFQAAKFG